MSKRKGDKTFMSLSPQECLNLYKEVLRNGNNLYQDSITLSDKGSYGSATSLLIHSLEESMKAFVLFLDGNKFQFRNKVKNISNLFDNHTLRYPLALSLSIITAFRQDLRKILLDIKSNPSQAMMKLSITKEEENLNCFFSYLKTRLIEIIKEIQWFSQAEIYRQEGFYADYNDKFTTPLNATKEDYDEVKVRIDNLNEFLNEFFESFQIEDQEFQEQIEKIKKWFETLDSNGKDIYCHLGEQIEKIRDRKTDTFGSMLEFITEFSNQLDNRDEA